LWGAALCREAKGSLGDARRRLPEQESPPRRVYTSVDQTFLSKSFSVSEKVVSLQRYQYFNNEYDYEFT
jgi:hypothetical protein